MSGSRTQIQNLEFDGISRDRTKITDRDLAFFREDVGGNHEVVDLWGVRRGQLHAGTDQKAGPIQAVVGFYNSTGNLVYASVAGTSIYSVVGS